MSDNEYEANIKKQAIMEFAKLLLDNSIMACIPRQKLLEIGATPYLMPAEIELINCECVKVDTINEILKEFLEKNKRSN